jgi:hypothetical protein
MGIPQNTGIVAQYQRRDKDRYSGSYPFSEKQVGKAVIDSKKEKGQKCRSKGPDHIGIYACDFGTDGISHQGRSKDVLEIGVV